jgi:hypothetical protein
MRPSRSRLLRLVAPSLLLALAASAVGCQGGGGGISGNEGGSEPVNSSEANEYKKAVVRCYKTGGTRVVKIMGELRCY